MSDWLDARQPPLEAPEKSKWLGKYLKEKYTWLVTHRRRANVGDVVFDNDGGFHHCAFGAGLLAARFFIQFLGLRVRGGRLEEWRKWKKVPGTARTTEVKIRDLDGEWVTLSQLKADEQELLARSWRGASEAVAHLTDGSDHGFRCDDFHPTIDIITRLLDEHLYAPLHIKPDWHGRKGLSLE